MNRGFTFIELLAVLAILALALAMGIPRFQDTYQSLRTDATLLALEKSIRYAQYQSVMEGKRYLLEYNMNESAYQILQEERPAGKTEWVPAQGRWGRKKRIPADLSLSIRGKNKIFFLPNGNVIGGDLVIRRNSQTLATLRLGQTLLGAVIERKKSSYAA